MSIGSGEISRGTSISYLPGIGGSGLSGAVSIVVLGDSIMAGNLPYETQWYPLGNYIPGTNVLQNGALGGQDSAAILAGAAAILDANLSAEWLVFDGGVIDVVGATTVDTTMTNLIAIAALGLARGMKVLYVSIPPWQEGGSWTAAIQRKMDELHYRMATYCNATADVYYAEITSALTDPAPSPVTAVETKLLAYRAAGGAGASHLGLAGVGVAGPIIASVLGSRSDSAPATTANTVVARYAGITDHDKYSVGPFVFRLARRNQWSTIKECFAFRMATSTHALIGMKSLTATLNGAPVHTPKVGYALTNAPTSINTGFNQAAQFPNYLTEGCFYGAYIHTLTPNPGTGNTVFGSVFGVAGTILFTGLYNTFRVSGQVDSFFTNQAQVGNYGSQAGLTAAIINKMLLIGRTGAWTATCDSVLQVGDAPEAPATRNYPSGVTAAPSSSNIEINGSQKWNAMTAALWFSTTDQLDRFQMLMACDYLEVNLAA